MVPGSRVITMGFGVYRDQGVSFQCGGRGCPSGTALKGEADGGAAAQAASYQHCGTRRPAF